MIPLQDTIDLVEMSGNSLCEFSIKSSARSFQILSNSLYKNKIRAIIRELSTNAYDSHVACGKEDIPFYVHFPTTLEPYFAIQDYGTGLSIEDIKNIYTVYFESTKTNTNNQIGELGLGCKSPYSYTKNFTITSIHNGIKSIYTAFINDRGVPDITLMFQDKTDESSGLSVQFAVNNNNDFRTFLTEAKYVYSYFPYTPNSNIEFTPHTRQYYIKDVIPGGHIGMIYSNNQTAIMGLIPYPIEIDSYNERFKNVSYLLRSNIELHFPIGELDIQPSREGLSYIPQTIDAIHNKLQEFHNALIKRIEDEANNIANTWDKATYLNQQKYNIYILRVPVEEYCLKYNFALDKEWRFFKSYLKDTYNLSISVYKNTTYRKGIPQLYINTEYINLELSQHVVFVINDLKTGAESRVKYHWNKKDLDYSEEYIYVLSPADPTQPIKYDAFFNEIYNPPKTMIVNASELDAPEKKLRTYNKDITILQLYHNQKDELMWKECDFSSFSNNESYYYVPLSGYKMISNFGYTDTKKLYNTINNCYSNAVDFKNFVLFGVRKGDLNNIKKKSNWINFEDYIVDQLKKISDNQLKYIAWSNISPNFYAYTNISELVSENSLYKHLADELNTHVPVTNIYQLLPIINKFYPQLNEKLEKYKEEYKKMATLFEDRYPLIKYMVGDTPDYKISDYVILLDSTSNIS